MRTPNPRPALDAAIAFSLHIVCCGRAVPEAERWALPPLVT